MSPGLDVMRTTPASGTVGSGSLVERAGSPPRLPAMDAMEDVGVSARPRRSCRDRVKERLTYQMDEGLTEKTKAKVRHRRGGTKRARGASPSLEEEDEVKYLDLPASEEAELDAGWDGSVSGLWEFACVLDFFSRFSQQLQFEAKKVEFDASDLERAIESEPGSADFNLLARIHVQLLLGLHPRSRDPPSTENWLQYLMKKAIKRWHEIGVGPNPFALEQVDPAGEANADEADVTDAQGVALRPRSPFNEQNYFTISPGDRLSLLRFLCELRAEHSDIRNRIEKAHTNTRKTAKKDLLSAKLHDHVTDPDPEQEFVDDFRREMVGRDHYGRKYWFIKTPPRMGHAWLCRENRAPETVTRSSSRLRVDKARKSRKKFGLQAGTGSRALPQLLPSWNVICRNATGLQDWVDGSVNHSLFGSDMRRIFRDQVLPEVGCAVEREERRQRAEARLVAQGIYMTENAEPRSARRRNVASYAEKDAMFDEMIEEAIQVQEGKRTPRTQYGRDLRAWSEDSLEGANRHYATQINRVRLRVRRPMVPEGTRRSSRLAHPAEDVEDEPYPSRPGDDGEGEQSPLRNKERSEDEPDWSERQATTAQPGEEHAHSIDSPAASPLPDSDREGSGSDSGDSSSEAESQMEYLPSSSDDDASGLSF